MMRIFSRFAPCYVITLYVHKVLAYPILRCLFCTYFKLLYKIYLTSNAVLIFYIMNLPLSPVGKILVHHLNLSKRAVLMIYHNSPWDSALPPLVLVSLHFEPYSSSPHLYIHMPDTQILPLSSSQVLHSCYIRY